MYCYSMYMYLMNLFCVQVPDLWASAAYPSLKPLSSWVKDLVLRLHFVEVSEWVNEWAAVANVHSC